MELALFADIDPNSDAYKIGRVIGIILAMLISGGICISAGIKKEQPVIGAIGALLASVASFFAGCLGGLPVAGLCYLVIVMVSNSGGTKRKKKQRKKPRREENDDEDDEYDRPRRSRRDDEDDEYDDRPRRSRRDEYDDDEDDRPRRRRRDDD